MGLLDDAIREHLELKRRSGADASELARLEHDAFGPIRGGRDEAPPEPAAEDAYDDEPVFDDEPVAPVSGAYAEDPAEAPPAPEEFEVPAAREPEPPPLAPEPAVAPPPPAEDPQATVAFSLDDLEAAQAAAAHGRAEGPGHAPDPDAPVRHGYDDDDVVPVTPDPDEGVIAPEPDIVPPDEEPVEIDEEHDELEETPDFLQETPEHDRLWFEQKPPRDFDF